MSRKKDSAPFANIGVSSLLVIFIILCLVVFATLTLSTAKSDYSFAQKLAQHKTEYYDASNKAETSLAALDKSLRKSGDLVSSAREVLGSGYNCNTADNTIQWQVPMNDSQALEVVIKVNRPYNKNSGNYTIKRWQTVSTVEQSEQTMNLFTTE